MLGSLLNPAKGIRSCTVFTLDLQKEKCPQEVVSVRKVAEIMPDHRAGTLAPCLPEVRSASFYPTHALGTTLKQSEKAILPRYLTGGGYLKNLPGEVAQNQTMGKAESPSSSPLFFGFFVGFCVLPKNCAQLLGIFGFSHATKPL